MSDPRDLLVETGTLAVGRLPADAPAPEWAQSVTRTRDELSVIGPWEGRPAGIVATGPWRCIRVRGPLAHDEVGVLAALASPLAEAGVPLFALSTHDTDRILVGDADLPRAVRALLAAGHVMLGDGEGLVLHVHAAPASGAPMRGLDRVEVRADVGLVGDRNARAGSHGQVTLVQAETLAAAEAELGRPIPPGGTRRNVTVAGVELDPRPGRRLRLGPVLLETTGPAEPCRLMDELLGDGAEQALRGRAGVRARVLEGGRLRVGDAVGTVSGDAQG